MINLRKVVAISATGALAAVGLATGAGAQTPTVSSSVITTTLAVSGPVPVGVAGYRVDIECSKLQGLSSSTTTQNLTATFGTAGGSVGLPFGLNPTSVGGGSSCVVRATPTGTSNLTGTVPVIKIGGTVRPVTLQTTPVVAGSATWSTAVTPIVAATDVVVTFTYPSIVVKKTVVGDETVPGTDYGMTIACTGSRPALRFDDITVNPTIVGGTNDKLLKNIYVTAGGVQTYVGTGNNVVFELTNLPPVNASGGAGLGFGAPVDASGATFLLKKDATRTFGLNEFPTVQASDTCVIREVANGGGATSFSSTQPALADGTASPPLPGVLVAGSFSSAATLLSGQTVTVTNSYTGDFIISKVVTGDPKTNIAVYEISVACDKGGPKETFLLKDRQSKVYTGIASGTNCLVTETRSDGATASYADNSGDNTTDGRVTIKATAAGCIDTRLAAFPDCRANVIVTNDYNVLATTTTAAAATTVAPATTAAPAITPAPPTAVIEEPTFTG